MRRTLATTTLIVASLAIAAPAHAAKHHGKRCAVAGSKTIFSDAKVRVFMRTYGPDLLRRTQVCRKSDGRHFGLAQDSSDASREGVGLISVAGDWMAYAFGRSTKSTTGGAACRFKISAGRRRCGSGLTVYGIGVTAAGTLAWLASSGTTDGGETCCVVSRLDRGAKDPVVLDFGEDIDRTSFAMNFRRAYWMKGGEPQTAPLR